MMIPKADDFVRLVKDPVWLDIAVEVLGRHNISFQILRRAEFGENVVFLIDDRFVLKIYYPFASGQARELGALSVLRSMRSVRVPEVVADGTVGDFQYLIMTALPGHVLSPGEWTSLTPEAKLGVVRQLGEILSAIHQLDAATFDFDWPAFIDSQIRTSRDRHSRNGGNPQWVDAIDALLKEYSHLAKQEERPVFLHGDVHVGNVTVVENSGKLEVAGIFDLSDSLKGPREYDFVAIGVLVVPKQAEVQKQLLRSYGYEEREINADLRRKLWLYTVLYEHSNLRRYAERSGLDPMDHTLEQLEMAIWSFA